MSTPQTPDYGEPWTLMSTGAVHDRNDNLVTEDSAKLRMLSCVNSCVGMADPAAEIESMQEAIKEAYISLEWATRTMNPPFEWEPFTRANASLAKLKPFLKP